MRLRGFTLLELLIALAIFATVAALAYGGLSSVLNAQATSDAHAQRLAQVQRSLLQLGRDLGQAAPRPIRDAFGDPQPALRSGGGELLFELSHAGWLNPAQQPRSRLQRIAYRIEDGRLIRSHWRVLDRSQANLPVDTVLLEGVHDASVEYLDERREWGVVWPPLDDEGGENGENRLPRGIRIRLDIESFGQIERLFKVAS